MRLSRRGAHCYSRRAPPSSARALLTDLARHGRRGRRSRRLDRLRRLAYLAVVAALRELRRALRPGGVLRVAVPDLERSIEAWLRGDAAYFYIGDDEVASIGGKLVVQAIWYGSTRTPFTWDFLEELARKAGFRHVARCKFGHTESRWPGIVGLDNRERESLYAEAVK
jgi:hypothetical protein